MEKETRIKVGKVTRLSMQMQKAVEGIEPVTLGDVMRVVLHTLKTSLQSSEFYGENRNVEDKYVYDQIIKTAQGLRDGQQTVDVILTRKMLNELAKEGEKIKEQFEQAEKVPAEETNPADSPMLKQFRDLKKKHPDALLLFRCGDFYETYLDDAEKAAKVLGITLTKSSKQKEENGGWLRMAGFPYHALDTYLPKLIRAGIRVAICDQIEAPKQTVKRGITELVQPRKEV